MKRTPIKLQEGGMYKIQGSVFKCLIAEDMERLGASQVQNIETGQTCHIADVGIYEDGTMDGFFVNGWQ